jgi:hypothetical protein
MMITPRLKKILSIYVRVLTGHALLEVRHRYATSTQVAWTVESVPHPPV